MVLKILVGLLTLYFVIPSVTMAAWYNPLSWFKKLNDGNLITKTIQLNNGLLFKQSLITNKNQTFFSDSLNIQQNNTASKSAVIPFSQWKQQQELQAQGAKPVQDSKTQTNPVGETLLQKAQRLGIQPASQLKQLTNSQIIKKVKPAVVYIETNDGAGSGMIISSDGNVLTNAHVVSGSTNVSISLSTGEKLSGIVIGRDEVIDLAVIEINSAQQFSKVDFGDSNKTEQGEEVFAFGFPFGIEGDVSFKEGTISRRIEEYFETSAEIHPGNSGGPLVNRYGQVIGINTAILGKSIHGIQLGETIKLAIPINNAKNLITELKAGRNVVVPTQRQTYPIIPLEDISNLSPDQRVIANLAYNEFIQTPNLQYLSPQQQRELFRQIAEKYVSAYAAKIQQETQEKKQELDRLNQLNSQKDALLAEYRQKINEIDAKILDIKQKTPLTPQAYLQAHPELNYYGVSQSSLERILQKTIDDANAQIQQLLYEKESLRLQYLNKMNSIQ